MRDRESGSIDSASGLCSDQSRRIAQRHLAPHSPKHHLCDACASIVAVGPSCPICCTMGGTLMLQKSSVLRSFLKWFVFAVRRLRPVLRHFRSMIGRQRIRTLLTETGPYPGIFSCTIILLTSNRNIARATAKPFLVSEWPLMLNDIF